MKHTQGEWKAIEDEEENKLLIVAPWDKSNNPGNSSGYGDYRGLHIACLYHQNDNPCVSKLQALANAQLIASAPELLEACRQADIVLNQRNVYLPKDKRITKEQAINSLCQAIANAEKL